MSTLSAKTVIGFYSTTSPGGIRQYTLTTLLGSFLREIEETYGRRDINYTILGVEISADDRPGIWFPGNCKHVCIRLGRFSGEFEHNAIAKLAHECIHLLCPSTGSAPVVEEGLASYFEVEKSKQYAAGFQLDELYDFYRKAYLALQAFDPHAIRLLRVERPYFKQWSTSYLMKIIPDIPQNLADVLCMSSETVESEYVLSGSLPSL